MKNSEYIYTCVLFFCGGLPETLLFKAVVIQHTRLTITTNDLPNFVLKIEDSLENNDIPLTIVQTFPNPNRVSIKSWDNSIF